jgi:hypothetical protein
MEIPVLVVPNTEIPVAPAPPLRLAPSMVFPAIVTFVLDGPFTNTPMKSEVPPAPLIVLSATVTPSQALLRLIAKTFAVVVNPLIVFPTPV